MMKSAASARARLRGAAVALAAVALAALAGGASAANLTEVNAGRSDLAVFLLEGPIQGGETLALEGFVGRLPPNRSVAVILNSPGGNLDEGMKLGRFVHRARVSTFVLGYGGGCFSACAIAFLGGRDRDGRPSRVKMTGGSLGFHQFRRVRDAAKANQKFTKADIEQEVAITRRTALSIIEYLSDIGEDMSFLHLMLKAPTADVNLLSNEEAVTLGIHVMDQRSEQVIDSANIRARTDGR
jgi:hypothetical protein